MQKTILVTLCIISAVFTTQAQTEPENPKNKKTTFGFRSGYEFQANNSNLEYNLNIPYVGAFSDISIGNKWSLQLELNLRSEHREELFYNGIKKSENELYLTVPVLLKYHISDKFRIYGGTQVLSASLKNDILGIKKWNGILGIEYNLNNNFFIEARYRQGFERRDAKSNFRDNRISVGIGYKF